MKEHSSLFPFRYHQRGETNKEIKQENMTNSKNMKEKLSNGCINIAITVIPFAMLEASVCSRVTNISRVASVCLELYYEQSTPIIGGIIYHVPVTHEPH